MASQKLTRATRSMKREGEDFIDQAAQDDAIEQAENRLKARQAKLASPHKLPKHARRQSFSGDDNDEEDGEDDSQESSLQNFIANDEEAENELYEADQQLKEKRREDKKDKKHRKKHIRQLEEDDLDLINENVGIEIKKKTKRLQRNPNREQYDDLMAQDEGLKSDLKQEEAHVQINTKKPPPHQASSRYKYEESNAKVEPSDINKRRRHLEIEEPVPHQHKQDKGRQIFGDQTAVRGTQDFQKVQIAEKSSNLKEFFNTDEIDDPFNTELDQKIAETDIPERLQVKLENRLEMTAQELAVEADWVLERLTSIPDPDNKYANMVHATGTKDKVLKVLRMFHIELFDIPMICKYRKYEYAVELDEDAVWHIWTLDQEYGRFQRNKAQINDFLTKVLKFDQKVKAYIDELVFAKTQSELNNFSALIRYLRYIFTDQLLTGEVDDGKRKAPQSRDEIQIARANRIHEFARYCFIECGEFQENLQYRKLTHQPPEPKASPHTVAMEFSSKVYGEPSELLQAVCRYTAIELAAQPQIRNMMKSQLRGHGIITTICTEQGKKDLDIFHQSYRVKLVDNQPLKQLANTDLYLDIQQCEKANLITVKIELPEHKHTEFRSFLEECYMDTTQQRNGWNLFRALVIKILVDEILNKELVKEVRDELHQEAEQSVLNSCKRVYTDMLMTGSFQTALNQQDQEFNQPEPPLKHGKRQEEIIKAKERLCVMGALMHQIDANNYIVTIAVVDKYGDLIHHKDFMRLLPPRVKRQRQPMMGGGAGQKDPMLGEVPKTEEELEHDRDRAKVIEILDMHSVDLIVVAANSLEARTLKRVMQDLGYELKNRKPAITEDTSSKKNQIIQGPKEAFVIWGSTEVAKLFALSHNSQKLHKGVQQILKQTISLARFEQCPMTEMLNLWSPIVAENQALALNLDPLQKLVNQAKLADALEECNIRVVNKVGVDLNLVIDHDHMHCILQFLSGLGPRMAKRLLGRAKTLNKKLNTRGELLKNSFLSMKIYFSVVPFVLIRIPDEEIGNKQEKKLDILDQTRIHHEHYRLAMKIATDACNRSENLPDQEQQEIDKTEQNLNCREVILRPSHLKNLDLRAYYQQLDMSNQGNMRIVIDQIIEEFRAPFADPRQARTFGNLAITDEKLFFLLIDENKRTFKRGLIVTATVSNVLDTKAICRLENGLTATVIKEKILDLDSNKKLKDELDIGYIITGRIENIMTNDGDKKFEVQLNCKKGDLHNHDKYLKDLAESLGIDPRAVLDEDKRNLNFSEAQKSNKPVSRFVARRIAHDRFKNISSRRALTELEQADVGEFIFRPSTRSEDAITLTWKFWKKQFVHIDIQEIDKMPGQAIGQRLMISNEQYDNLREIVERYIIPCNRLVREVTTSPKWSDCDKWEDLEQQLKEEKTSDKGRIPYRFAILPQYQQHIVLAYVPRERVTKEFVKVRPKGFYFHEQNHAPFMQLVNWFKDQWQAKDYQRFLKRQKSPRTSVRMPTNNQIKEQNQMNDQEYGNDQGGGHQWQAQGGGSVYSNHGGQGYGGVKQEQRQYTGRQSHGRDSPGYGQASGNWDNNRMKYETGGRSPAAWQQNAQQYDQDANMQQDRQFERRPTQRSSGNACFKCNEEGHMARECPNQDSRRDGGQRKGCFNCGEDGHIARDCHQPQKERSGDRGRGGNGGGGANQECYRCRQVGHISRDCPTTNGGQGNQEDRGYKRQRVEGGSLRRNAEGGFAEGGALRRNADGGFDLNASGWDDNNNQTNNNWGDQQQQNNYTPKHEGGGWNGNDGRYN